MSEPHKPYPRSFYAGELPNLYKGYDALNVAPPVQQASAQSGAGQQVNQAAGGGIQAQASPIPELWTAVYALSGLMIRSVTGMKARKIAAHELAVRLVAGLEEKIQASMKALPETWDVDAVRYEVQFLIHTRKEFEQAVRAEAKKLLENALS